MGRQQGERKRETKWPWGICAAGKPWRSVDTQAGGCCRINSGRGHCFSLLIAVCPDSAPYFVCIHQHAAIFSNFCFFRSQQLKSQQLFLFQRPQATRCKFTTSRCHSFTEVHQIINASLWHLCSGGNTCCLYLLFTEQSAANCLGIVWVVNAATTTSSRCILCQKIRIRHF